MTGRLIRRKNVQADLDRLQRRILDGPGVTTPEQRKSAADAAIREGPLGQYLLKVNRYAYRITDEQVAALLSSGHDEDEIFELTIAASLGASRHRLDVALDAIAAVYDEEPGGQK